MILNNFSQVFHIFLECWVKCYMQTEKKMYERIFIFHYYFSLICNGVYCNNGCNPVTLMLYVHIGCCVDVGCRGNRT